MKLIDVEAVLNEGDPERVVGIPLRLVLQARRLQQLYERHVDIDVFQHLQALVESLATCGDEIEWRPTGETGYWNPEEDEDEEVEVGSSAALPQEAPAAAEEPANPYREVRVTRTRYGLGSDPMVAKILWEWDWKAAGDMPRKSGNTCYLYPIPLDGRASPPHGEEIEDMEREIAVLFGGAQFRYLQTGEVWTRNAEGHVILKEEPLVPQ